jgi:hypothetical protein
VSGKKNKTDARDTMTYIKLAENKKPGDNSEIGFYDVEIKVFL